MLVDWHRFGRISSNGFHLAFVIDASLILYVAATTSIDVVPREFPFGFLKVLPASYWIALGLTIALLFVAVRSGVTKYLWVSAVLLTVLIPGMGDLLQAHPRDIFIMTLADRISRIGRFSPADNVFLNFPGSAILFSLLSVSTSAPLTIVMRISGLLYNILLLGLGFVFFRRSGIREILAVLSALVVVLSFYMQGALLYTSFTGFIFYIAIAGIVFSPGPSRIADAFLLVTFFTSMVVSHAFSPFLTIAGLSGLLVGWRFADRLFRAIGLRRLSGDQPRADLRVLAVFFIILTTYWAYFAFLPFLWALARLKSINLFTLFEETVMPLLRPNTVYAFSYSRIAILYAPVLFFALAVHTLWCRNGKKLQLLTWILGLGGTLVTALSGYAEELLARIFSFAILPLGYSVASTFNSKPRYLQASGIIVLVAVMGLHLPAHYGQDSFVLIQESTIQGVKFLAQYTYSNASFDSPLRELRERYYIDNYKRGSAVDLGPGSYYILNYKAESWILYSSGDSALEELVERVNSNRYNKVYSDGWFNDYLLNQP
jgi:hypothetical protein